MPARVGFARAAEMAMLGERVDAEHGARVGPREPGGARTTSSRPRSDALAERLAAGPTRSYAGSKRQLNALASTRALDEQLELEAAIQQELAASGDFAEGVAAFREKRAPDLRRA